MTAASRPWLAALALAGASCAGASANRAVAHRAFAEILEGRREEWSAFDEVEMLRWLGLLPDAGAR